MNASLGVILAAGMGTRMRSTMPKAMHAIAGQPMLRHLIDSAAMVFDRLVVVVGPGPDTGMEALAALAAPHPVVIQQERLGTAHAALQAVPLFGDGEVAVLYADNPLIQPATLAALLARRQEGDADLALLAMRPPDPGRYGRVIVNGGYVERIAEWVDATPMERAEPLCNAGVLCAAASNMAAWLRAVRNDNEAGEYYLTDIVRAASRVAAVEAPYSELRGINSRAELAAAEATVQTRLRDAALAVGVTMTDPSSVFLCMDTNLAPDVTLGPNIVFGRGVTVEKGAEILAFCHLEGCHIGPGARIGPFARIRPGTVLGPDVHIGNFMELKAATLGAGVKAGHLSYLGDVDIGERTNIGAGTITCNYDGHAKHRTHIGADAFIGSDSALIAPVTVGQGAMTAAGSVITDDVPAHALAIARGRQVTKTRRKQSTGDG
jgi:bifunctional UDP-N-acetylglucosamine pyrophosphorylase/glucosamine-1-phosphate N-acetyltransferase